MCGLEVVKRVRKQISTKERCFDRSGKQSVRGSAVFGWGRVRPPLILINRNRHLRQLLVITSSIFNCRTFRTIETLFVALR